MNLKTLKFKTVLVGFVGGAAALAAGGVANAATSSPTLSHHQIDFGLQRSAASLKANCLVKATAQVHVVNKGDVEQMTITAAGLPKNTDFDVFVTQLPNAPFGISWYQGDLSTDKNGKATRSYVGRFSVETFAVAPNVGPAPSVHNTGTIKDATTNPAFGPVHTYHVGLWFNSPKDAAAAGCANTVTPFNGEHNAGPQALSTRQFADVKGPLRYLQP